MSDCGHGTDSLALTSQGSAEPCYRSLEAALQAARPTLVRLYAGFQRRRQAQIAEFVASFRSTHGRRPTAPDLAAGLVPRISAAAARWYLAQSNGRDRGDELFYSIPASPQPRNGAGHGSRCRTQVASTVPVAQHR